MNNELNSKLLELARSQRIQYTITEHVYRSVPFTVSGNGTSWNVAMQISAGTAGIMGISSENAAIDAAKRHIDIVLDQRKG